MNIREYAEKLIDLNCKEFDNIRKVLKEDYNIIPNYKKTNGGLEDFNLKQKRLIKK